MRSGTEERDPEVDLPQHYGGDECMKLLELAGWGRAGCLFNIGKYLYRLGAKGGPVQDARKALWYARRLSENAGYSNARGVNWKEYETISTCASHGLLLLTEEQVREVNPIIQEIRTNLMVVKREMPTIGGEG